MYIYNVSVFINKEVEEDWKKWMKEVHMPEVVATGFFTHFKMLKILFEKDEEHSGYSMQYTFSDMKDLQLYQADAAIKLQKQVNDRYKDQFTAFRTVLEEI